MRELGGWERGGLADEDGDQGQEEGQDPYTRAFVEVESHDLFWEYI